MSTFRKVRIGDDVVAQERLRREHFGIERLAVVVGGSMGAQQTYEYRGEYGSNADVVDGLKRHSHLWAIMGMSRTA